jgi:hypothetical protein
MCFVNLFCDNEDVNECKTVDIKSYSILLSVKTIEFPKFTQFLLWYKFFGFISLSIYDFLEKSV